MILLNKNMKNLISFSYEITMACNLRCPYCIVKDKLNNSQTIDLNKTKKIFDKLKEFSIENPEVEINIEFLGGEPFFNDDIFTAIDMWYDLKINNNLNIISNLIFSDLILSKLKEYLIKYPTLRIVGSWHTLADENTYLYNLKELYKFDKIIYSPLHRFDLPRILPVFILDDRDKKTEFKYNWMKKNKKIFAITHLTDQNNKRLILNYTGLNKQIYNDSIMSKYKIQYNDKIITKSESDDMNLETISSRNHVICTPVYRSISYDGIIDFSCVTKNNQRVNILKEKFIYTPVYCRDGFCHCNIKSNMKILQKKQN